MDIEADDLIIVSGASAALDAEGREKLAAARQTLRQHLRRYKRRMDDDKRTKCVPVIRERRRRLYWYFAGSVDSFVWSRRISPTSATACGTAERRGTFWCYPR